MSGVLTAEEKQQSWRLLKLIDAYTKGKRVLELDDVQKLGLIAGSGADLHAACKALEQGCKLDTAVSIFT